MRRPAWARIAALVPLRLAVGAGLFAHGFAKVAHGPQHFVAIVEAMGVPAPATLAVIAIAIELATGVAILTGAFVRLAAVAAAAVVGVAVVGIHLRYGFLSVRLAAFGPDGARFGPVGYELGLVYLAALAALVASDPTPWSIDRWRASRRRERLRELAAAGANRGRAHAAEAEHESASARATEVVVGERADLDTALGRRVAKVAIRS